MSRLPEPSNCYNNTKSSDPPNQYLTAGHIIRLRRLVFESVQV